MIDTTPEEALIFFLKKDSELTELIMYQEELVRTFDMLEIPLTETPPKIKTAFEANKLAIIALKEQIGRIGLETPKIIIMEPWNPAKCPNCDYFLSEHAGDGYYRHHYVWKECPDCGQKLKWEAGE